MKKKKNTAISLAVVTLAAWTVSAGLAWACIPQADITVGPRSATAGTQVTVSGNTFGARTVEIHWDSTNGPLLGTAAGPSFQATVTVPRATAGVHYLVGVAYNPDRSVAGKQASPFELLTPASSQPEHAGKPAPKHRPAHLPAPRRSPGDTHAGIGHSKDGASDSHHAVTNGAPPPAAAHTAGAAVPATRSAATPKVATRAVARSRPKPRGASPLAPPLSNPWSVRRPVAPRLGAGGSRGNASVPLLAVGIGLLALGLAALGGTAGYTLVRLRPRQSPPEVSAGDRLPIPEFESESRSLEAELEELIQTSSAAAGSESSTDEQERQRETADSSPQ